MHKTLPNFFTEIGTTYEANIPSFHSLLHLPSNQARRKRKHKDLRWQIRQLDALLTAMDRHGAAFSLWNYCPENDALSGTEIGDCGDDWNGEDFSFAYTTPAGQTKMRCLDAILVNSKAMLFCKLHSLHL